MTNFDNKNELYFVVHSGWRLLLTDLKFDLEDIAVRAELPRNILFQGGAKLTPSEYLRLWDAINFFSKDPQLPIRLGSLISAEIFDPPVYAALCCPNLAIALERLVKFKNLCTAIKLTAKWINDEFWFDIEWLDSKTQPPPSLIAAEMVYFVQFARIATRHEVKPISILSKSTFGVLSMQEYFGVQPKLHNSNSIVFSREDAERQFLTEKTQLFNYFEAGFNQDLANNSKTNQFTSKVKKIVLQLLPTGQATIENVASKIYVSSRTLQRFLRAEGTSFRQLLDETRIELAKIYYDDKNLKSSQIALLLGFKDTNSLYRALKRVQSIEPEMD